MKSTPLTHRNSLIYENSLITNQLIDTHLSFSKLSRGLWSRIKIARFLAYSRASGNLENLFPLRSRTRRPWALWKRLFGKWSTPMLDRFKCWNCSEIVNRLESNHTGKLVKFIPKIGEEKPLNEEIENNNAKILQKAKIT